MRTLIAFFLSLFLTLNAANAAIHGVCDVFEHGQAHDVVAEHDAHPGHHGHDSEDGDEVKVTPDVTLKFGADTSTGSGQMHPDHCHAHPSFSSLLTDRLSLPVMPDSIVLSAIPADALKSAVLRRLERPPRAHLA